jgi:hypothetical protein
MVSWYFRFRYGFRAKEDSQGIYFRVYNILNNLNISEKGRILKYWNNFFSLIQGSRQNKEREIAIRTDTVRTSLMMEINNKAILIQFCFFQDDSTNTEILL